MKIMSRNQWRCDKCGMQFVDNSNIDFPFCASEQRMSHDLKLVDESSEEYVKGAVDHFKLKGSGEN